MKKRILFLLLSAVPALFTAVVGCRRNTPDEKVLKPPQERQMIYGIGYVRGGKRVVLKNKVAGFVSKVNCLSQARVKKGDVILEYDDLDLRTQIENLKNTIAEQEKLLELKTLALDLKLLDPLPSDYRNLQSKQMAAKERLRRLEHELSVYSRLYRSKIVSELALREKTQACKDSEAEVQSYSNDMDVLNRGLGKLYITIAEKEVEEARLKLENRRRELQLLEEQRKYYRITAPFDGICITNSDTVHGYNPVNTEAASIHSDNRKLVYAYFDERDVGWIVEGRPCRFRSSQYDPEKTGYFTVTPYEVKKDRTAYGDRCFFLVKFTVDKEPEPLRIESTGRVEIETADSKPPHP